MKIAIQGHPFRGKEVIQILESLGGKNTDGLEGTYDTFYYIDDKNEICDDHKKNFLPTYKLYTLEEFEKEFPFKVGDKVIHKEFNDFFEVISFNPESSYPYKIKGVCKFNTKSHVLTKWQPKMKEERFVTLTLDKAKEWYNKGGELKEIALQAFTEKELTKVDLPKTWEEFCDNYPVKGSEATIGCDARIISCMYIEGRRRSYKFKDIMPSEQSAEAHLAMIQLEQLRDCYRGLFVTVIGMPVWNISMYDGKPHIFQAIWGKNQSFLSFQSKEVAEEYLENFKPLIEKAGDLI